MKTLMHVDSYINQEQVRICKTTIYWPAKYSAV